MSEVFRSARDGFETIGLRNQWVRIEMAPALGGKIISLRDKRSGREWMWHRGDRLKLFSNVIGDAFEHSTMAGADECLPSVAACRVGGKEIPDHGEVWSVPWEIETSKLAEGKLALHVSLGILPFDFYRTISLEEHAVKFEYRLRNRSDRMEHYLWAFHPLLRIERGDEICVSPALAEVRVETSSWEKDARGEKWSWPRPRGGIDIEKMELGAATAFVKCFAEQAPRPASGPATRGRVESSANRSERAVAIVNAGREERLVFEIDSLNINAVGLWLTRGGWNGYHHVAIEPTNAAGDSLERGIEENLCEPVAANSSIEWSFRMVLGA